MDKLGIIVPYRSRPDQLTLFKKKIHSYLFARSIQYELIIVTQNYFTEFNRGKLLNIGFIKAKELGCNYVCFHDIDMLPVKVDYSYADRPTQLANRFIYEVGVERTISDEYFGGVTIFPKEDFEKISVNLFEGYLTKRLESFEEQLNKLQTIEE